MQPLRALCWSLLFLSSGALSCDLCIMALFPAATYWSSSVSKSECLKHNHNVCGYDCHKHVYCVPASKNLVPVLWRRSHFPDGDLRCILPVDNAKLRYVIMIIILLPQVRSKLLKILESLSHLFYMLLLGWKQVAFVQSRFLQVTISSKQNSLSSAP